MSDSDIHHEEFAVWQVQQFTGGFVAFHRQHGVQRACGQLLLFKRKQQRHAEQSAIRIALVALVLVHERLVVGGEQDERGRHFVSTESTLQWHQFGDHVGIGDDMDASGLSVAYRWCTHGDGHCLLDVFGADRLVAEFAYGMACFGQLLESEFGIMRLIGGFDGQHASGMPLSLADFLP